MRGGYMLFKELGESRTVPTLLMVLDDLEEIISKMPTWKSSEATVTMPYKDMLVTKRVVYNSHPVAEKAVQQLQNGTFLFE
jgi:hypothetical protein